MKKGVVPFLLLLISSVATAQQPVYTDSEIDQSVRWMEATTPDSLARMLTQPYTTQREKVRAIYSWITSHISYNTYLYQPRKNYKIIPDPFDTMQVWPSGEEMMALRVLHRRKAVCEGYSKLFKVLCRYAGIEAEVILGFARTSAGSKKFRTNHSWNAVRIDSAWHLLDVTWASGYSTFTDEYIAQQNDRYFLTPPQQFIMDHYPEDQRWALLQQLPTLPEFDRAPFRTQNFSRYQMISSYPSGGLVEAAEGDTLLFEVQLQDSEKIKNTAADPTTDSLTFALWPGNVFLKPVSVIGNTVRYLFVSEGKTSGLCLLFNNDVVLHYRIRNKVLTGQR